MPTPGELITQNGTTVGGYDSAGNAAYFGGPPTATAVAPVAAPTTTVSTSDPARSNYSAIEQAIAKLSGNPPAVPGAPTNAPLSSNQALLEDRRSQLQKRRDAEVERLGKEFDSAKASQGQAQKSETGTSSMGLARIGGFDSASGQAVLTNLQRVHEGEQQDLLNKRQAAIAQAQNAYEDKDFALAQLQLEDAREAEKLIYDRQKDFINLSLQLKGEQRADLESQRSQLKFEYEMMKDNTQFALENNIKTPFYIIGGEARDTKTGERLSKEEYLARGGKEDFSNAFIVEPGSKEARAYAYDMATKYGDAGILPTDDPATIKKKIESSAIYREQIRPPSSGGGQKSTINDDQNAFFSGVINGWQEDGLLNSGYIGSGEYKQAKQAYVKKFTGYIDNPGKTFDENMALYVNTSKPGDLDTNPQSTTYGQPIKGTGYQRDYGIN